MVITAWLNNPFLFTVKWSSTFLVEGENRLHVVIQGVRYGNGWKHTYNGRQCQHQSHHHTSKIHCWDGIENNCVWGVGCVRGGVCEGWGAWGEWEEIVKEVISYMWGAYRIWGKSRRERLCRCHRDAAYHQSSVWHITPFTSRCSDRLTVGHYRAKNSYKLTLWYLILCALIYTGSAHKRYK